MYKPEDVIVIGIAGGTGCGKSTMIKKIKDEFNDSITIISHDFYYKYHDMSFEERKKLNYDHPSSFDTDMLIEHIKELKKGNSIMRPVYDFTIHNRIDETVEVKPAKVIIVEGILIFENEALRDLCDIKVFIDTDADVRIIRRIIMTISILMAIIWPLFAFLLLVLLFFIIGIFYLLIFVSQLTVSEFFLKKMM